MNCIRVYNVVCSNNDCNINIAHLWVHFITCLELFIRNICFGKKNVHMTRHTTGNRVNCKVYFGTICFQLIAEFLYSVLSLSNSHTISRNNYNVLCSFKNNISIFYRNCLWFLCRTVATCLLLCTKALEKKVRELAVHSLTHDEGKDKAGSSNETAGNYKYCIVDCKSGEGSSKTRQSVQEGNDYRHIATTNWNYHCKSKDKEGSSRSYNADELDISKTKRIVFCKE